MYEILILCNRESFSRLPCQVFSRWQLKIRRWWAGKQPTRVNWPWEFIWNSWFYFLCFNMWAFIHDTSTCSNKFLLYSDPCWVSPYKLWNQHFSNFNGICDLSIGICDFFDDSDIPHLILRRNMTIRQSSPKDVNISILFWKCCQNINFDDTCKNIHLASFRAKLLVFTVCVDL